MLTPSYRANTSNLGTSKASDLKRRPKCLYKDYKDGDKVYALTTRKSKIQPVYSGPHEIETVHTNGTVTIHRDKEVQERINIRQLKPTKG